MRQSRSDLFRGQLAFPPAALYFDEHLRLIFPTQLELSCFTVRSRRVPFRNAKPEAPEKVCQPQFVQGLIALPIASFEVRSEAAQITILLSEMQQRIQLPHVRGRAGITAGPRVSIDELLRNRP